MSRQIRILLAVITAGLMPGYRSSAATTLSAREELQDAYRKQQTNTPSLFDTLPVQQIVPLEDTITFALAGAYKDVTVAPVGTDVSSNRSNLPERLDLQGWSASPYIALSAKHFGFGFTGEVGRMTARYQLNPSLASNNQSFSPGGFNDQQGVVNYSGIGAYLYLSPGWRILPKSISVNFIAGGKSLNVQHQTSEPLYNSSAARDLTKYRYAVHNIDAGVNLALRLVKRFTVIPWVDFSSNFVSKPTNTNQAQYRYQNASVDTALKDDIDLFWNSEPRLRYGLDFVVNILRVDVHFGGLLGLLGNLNKGADRIQDNSRYISLSFDIKG